jgi:hypothetical protein
VEIYYRVRCAGGKLSEEHVTRGVRLDFEKGKLTTGADRQAPVGGDDASKKSASGAPGGVNKGQQAR